MQTQPAFGLTQLLTQIVGDVAKAISVRDGETKQQQVDRSLAVVHLIMGFLPRDGTEAMLAGHCVMFHAIMIESLHEILCEEQATTQRGARRELVALNRAFSGNLDRLRKLQADAVEGATETSTTPQARTVATQTKNESPMQAQRPMRTQSPLPVQPMNRAARRQADRALKRTDRPSRDVPAQMPPVPPGNTFPGSSEASGAGDAAD